MKTAQYVTATALLVIALAAVMSAAADVPEQADGGIC